MPLQPIEPSRRTFTDLAEFPSEAVHSSAVFETRPSSWRKVIALLWIVPFVYILQWLSELDFGEPRRRDDR